MVRPSGTVINLQKYSADHGAGKPTGLGWDPNLLRDAQMHFERVRAIDPSNVVAAAFLSQVNAYNHTHAPHFSPASLTLACGIKLSGGTPPARDRDSPDPDSDSDIMDVDHSAKDSKRMRP